MEIEEVDDKEFNEIVAEKRHKELINSLKLMLVELQKDNKDQSIRASVDKIADNINKFVSLPKSEIVPEVKVEVETNQDKVVLSFQQMSQQIIKELGVLIEKIESTPVIDRYEWTFERGVGNLIYKANAKIFYK